MPKDQRYSYYRVITVSFTLCSWRTARVGDLFLFVCLCFHFLCITLQNVSLTRGRRLPVCLKWSCLPAGRRSGRPASSLDFLPDTLAHSRAAGAPHLSQ